jgi:hypothetical protein
MIEKQPRVFACNFLESVPLPLPGRSESYDEEVDALLERYGSDVVRANNNPGNTKDGSAGQTNPQNNFNALQPGGEENPEQGFHELHWEFIAAMPVHGQFQMSQTNTGQSNITNGARNATEDFSDHD